LPQQASCLPRSQNIDSPKIRRLFLPVKSLPVDTHQFVFFHQKIHGISQRDSGIDMFLYNTFLTERCVVEGETIVLFQQASVAFARQPRVTGRASPPAELLQVKFSCLLS
jgi:hypothetical protein